MLCSRQTALVSAHTCTNFCQSSTSPFAPQHVALWLSSCIVCISSIYNCEMFTWFAVLCTCIVAVQQRGWCTSGVPSTCCCMACGDAMCFQRCLQLNPVKGITFPRVWLLSPLVLLAFTAAEHVGNTDAHIVHVSIFFTCFCRSPHPPSEAYCDMHIFRKAITL